MIKRILSAIISVAMIISVFSVNVSAASLDGLSMSYTFTNQNSGVADGTVTISGITEELQGLITNINIYWGKNSTEALDDYYNLKNYTVEGPVSASTFSETKLEYTNEALVWEITGSRLIAEGATHLIADVIITETNAETSEAVTTTKQLSVEIPENKRFNFSKDDMLYSMLWTSDLHADSRSFTETSNANKAFEDMVRISDMAGDKFKGTVINGDISNSAKYYEYTIIENLIEQNKIDFPIYFASGNHDTSVDISGLKNVSAELAKAMDVRFDKLENQFGLTFDRSDPWSYETYIGGQHYIFLATPYVTSFSLSSSQAKWLEEKLCYNEKSGIPTYIFTHLPYENSGLTRRGGAFDCTEFEKILQRHPSAVVITSHVHMELDTDIITANAKTDIGVPAIDTSAITYTNGIKGDWGRGCYGRYVEIYEDKIILKSRRFSSQKWAPRSEYLIPIANSDKAFAGDFTVDYADTLMSEGTVLTAKLNGSAIDTNVYTVNWYDMSGNVLQEGGNTFTVTTANASVSAKAVASDGAYAYAVARYIAPVVDDGDDEITEPEVTFDGNTTVRFYNNILNISGNLDSSYAGKKAILLLIPKATYTDLTTAEYINECTIAADGSYFFKFKSDAVDLEEDYVFILKTESGEITKNEVLPVTTEQLVELTATYDSQTGNLNATIKNKFLDETVLSFIIANYGENKLFNSAVTIPLELTFNENGEAQSTSVTVEEPGKTLKVFIWKDLTSLKPVSNYFETDVTPAQTEEITE